MRLHLIRWLALVCLSGLLTSCSDPKLAPLSHNATIVAFGDSLTFGVGANPSTNYPSALAALTGLTVINAGISGETTAQGVERFGAVLDEHTPELVILLEGGNDILRGHNLTQTKSNLSQMIAMAKTQGVQLILVGVPEKKLFSDSAPFYDELAEQYDLVYDGESLSDLLRKAKYKSDAIHLNSAGYQQLAEKIYALMQDNGAL